MGWVFWWLKIIIYNKLMVLYTIYRITHKDFPKLNYIGSTLNFKDRMKKHRNDFYNPKRDSYRKKLYTYIRENHINFCDLNFEILDTIESEDYLQVRTEEQNYIEMYDSINNGLNKHKSFNKNYHKNKEKYQKINSKKFHCVCCNSFCRYKDKNRHFKTLKHFINCDKLDLIKDLYS
jgi:hypothetical protein